MRQLHNVKPAPCGVHKSISTHIQSGVSSHFGSCAALPFLHNSLQFFFGLSFLQRFRFYVGENSRTFQDCRVEFKDLSRIFGNPGLFKTSQTLFKALSTLICFQKHLRPHLSFSYHFHPSTLQCRICFANAFIPSMRMLNWTRRMRISIYMYQPAKLVWNWIHMVAYLSAILDSHGQVGWRPVVSIFDVVTVFS